MSRFFTEPSNINGKFITITDEQDIKHLVKVLRLEEGNEVDISDGTTWEYKGKISKIEDDKVTLVILDKQKFAREPQLEITLFQGIPKAGKMETIIQKTVELGVFSVVPVFMERTVVVDKGNFNKKIERWQKISNEAVKQCKRGIVPEIRMQQSFDEMRSALSAYDMIIFPYENENNYTIKDCLKNLKKKPKTVAVVIGPEGGFSDKEAHFMQSLGAEQVTLGKTILRTETAGMAAIAMIMYELEL